MKLHNLLLTAALFLAVGIVSATEEDPVDENALRETTYSFDSTTSGGHTGFFYNTSGNNTLTVTLLQYVGSGEDEHGWTFYAVGYGSDGTKTFMEALTLDNAHIDGSVLSSDELASSGIRTYRVLEDGETLNVYKFSVPFDDATTEKIGFAGKNGSNNHLVYSIENDEMDQHFHFSDKGTHSLLFFGKNDFVGGQLKSQIVSGGSYFDGGSSEGGGTFGSPLPAPLTTLLIALGFGAALAMYRSRKQARA